VGGGRLDRYNGGTFHLLTCVGPTHRLDLALSPEHLKVLDEASRIELGFPHACTRSPR
jgi:hypothetical protein